MLGGATAASAEVGAEWCSAVGRRLQQRNGLCPVTLDQGGYRLAWQGERHLDAAREMVGDALAARTQACDTNVFKTRFDADGAPGMRLKLILGHFFTILQYENPQNLWTIAENQRKTTPIDVRFLILPARERNL